MNICQCERALPDADDLSCVLCGRSSVAALEIDPHDAQLHYARRIGFGHWEVPEDEPAEEIETDCILPCWKKVDGGTECQCEEDGIGTTSDPDGW